MRWAYQLACSTAMTSVVLSSAALAQDHGATVRDSGGVAIVENNEPAWSDTDGWRFGAHPVLEIGELEGNPEYELHRVTGALKLRDGRIVVANSGTYQLRFFDSNGAYISDCGRRGGGPGEFEGLSGVSLFRTDSLATFDWRQNRISIFSSDGSFARALRLRSTDALSDALGSFSDGSILSRSRSSRADGETGAIRPDWILIRLDTDGTIVDTLGSFPGDEMFIKQMAGDLSVSATQFFARSSEFAVLGDRFYVAPTENFEIQVYNSAGQLEMLIRKAHENLDVTRADITHLRNQMLQRFEDDPNRRLAIERTLDAMPMHSTMPAISSLRVDDSGNIWVQAYSRPGEENRDWWVFSTVGRLLGTVQAPANFRLLHIGEDFVLGRWRDDLEVEHVQLYGLIKP